MTREDILDDLAYARAIAEEGRQAPLIGGAYLVMFGALLALTYAAHWAIVTGVIALPGMALGVLWASFGLVAGIGSQLVYARVRGMPGASAMANRIDRTVWLATNLAILTVVAGSLIAGVVTSDPNKPNSIMPAAYSLYGVALLTTAMIAQESWLRLFAFASFGVSGVLWIFLNEPWAYLLGSASALVVLFVPGVILIRRQPSAIV